MAPPRKPLVTPGNGLMGQFDETLGLDALAQQFPDAAQTDLNSTFQAQLTNAKQKRQQSLMKLAPPPATASGLGQAPQYSPF